jgi:hypothetical protein
MPMTASSGDVVTLGASIRSTVISVIATVATEQSKVLAPLSDDLLLLESGLDSLCIAIIVARLDDQFGVDPFASGDEMSLPTTVGDFVRIYENATG